MSYTVQKLTSQILVSIQDELTIAQVRGLWDELLAAGCVGRHVDAARIRDHRINEAVDPRRVQRAAVGRLEFGGHVGMVPGADQDDDRQRERGGGHQREDGIKLGGD